MLPVHRPRRNRGRTLGKATYTTAWLNTCKLPGVRRPYARPLVPAHHGPAAQPHGERGYLQPALGQPVRTRCALRASKLRCSTVPKVTAIESLPTLSTGSWGGHRLYFVTKRAYQGSPALYAVRHHANYQSMQASS